MKLEFLNLINNKNSKKKKKEIPISRIWSHRTSIHPIDLQNTMENDDNELNYFYSLLFTDNRDIYKKNPTYKRKQVHKKKNLAFLKHISGEAEKILNDIYTKINYMKDKTKELNKLNTLSMQKTSKNYFRTNRPKTFNINNRRKKRPESASTYHQNQTINFNLSNSKTFTNNRFHNFNESKNISNLNNLITPKETNNIYYFTNENTKEETKEIPNSNLNSFIKRRNISSAINRNKKSKTLLNFNKSKFPFKINLNYKLNEKSDLLIDEREEKFRKLINVDVEKLYSKNKKKKLNLSRLNDEYRVQMNKSFTKYKSRNHLKELNKFQRDDMSVRQDMEIVKSKINKKINDRCQGQYFKKLYLKLKNANEKDKKAKSLIKRSLPVQIPFNILLRNTNHIRNVKFNPHGYKIRAYYDFCGNYEKKQKLQNKDLLKFKNNLKGHFITKDYKFLNSALDELFNLLETEPVINYIDNFKNEKPNRDKDELNERIKTYFPALTETEKKIQKIIDKHKKPDNENILDKIDEIKNLLNIPVIY